MCKATLSLTRIAGALGAVTLLLVGTTDAALAQQNGTVRPPPVKDPRRESIDRQSREASLRSAELLPPVEKMDQTQVEAVIQQMKEDFKGIQIVRNQLARDILANKPFDYRLVSDEAAEVNKRAERLKRFLKTATAENGKSQNSEVEFNNQEMKSALVRLCKLIDRFVENPALKDPASVDVQQSAKASGDLLGIIELSGKIKRGAVKLSKETK